MLQNIPREKVLQVVRQRGPTIPSRIVKELGGDTFLIGAILSDLLKSNLVKYTHLKFGGTPFYYTSEQKHKLTEISQHLKGKEKEVYDMLKESKVLKDEEQEPAVRVGLRMIKDFSKPLEVKIGEKQELFWKFFLIDNEEVKNIIKEKFMTKQEKKSVEKENPVETAAPKKIIKKVEAKKEEPKEKIFEKKREEQQPLPKQEDKKIEKKQEEKPKEEPKEEKVSILKEDLTKGSFAETVYKYFQKKNIEVLEKNMIRKTEIDYIIRVPSSIGTMEYYCKAKSKKKCNDGDIATAFIQGQTKKLPVLFLTTGDITKKAQEMLSKEFKGIVLNRI